MMMDFNRSTHTALVNKNILLCISGGIAAYKCAELVRKLVGAGAKVRVAMTESAQAFITPLTMQALSTNYVHTSLLDPQAELGMSHIELARWADLVLVAPATANTLARLATGAADDLVSTLCLATRAPIVIAPAMNQVMWEHPATRANMETLRQRGVKTVGPGVGAQACGEVGVGRMEDVETLVSFAAEQFKTGLLAGLKVLITAGPTREALDPVRYISNRSSGKMGYALAQAAAEAGATVELVSGPVNLAIPAGVNGIAVESAIDMHREVMARADTAEIVIAAAAVADYRARDISQEKLKKSGTDSMTIELVKNPDIVADVAALEGQRLVMGFAAETQSLHEYALDKLKRKGLDAIVANDVSRSDIGFDSDSNAARLYTRNGEHIDFSKRSKSQLARDLIAWLAQQVKSDRGE